MRDLVRQLEALSDQVILFVDDIAQMPQLIVEQARDGDVVIAMGAGTIGAVAGQVAELLKEGA